MWGSGWTISSPGSSTWSSPFPSSSSFSGWGVVCSRIESRGGLHRHRHGEQVPSKGDRAQLISCESGSSSRRPSARLHSWRFIFVHILPMPWLPDRAGDVGMGNIILIEAGLDFLGFGAHPPSGRVGAVISVGRSISAGQWWWASFPARIIQGVASFSRRCLPMRSSADDR
jgi:hypothetical protein